MKSNIFVFGLILLLCLVVVPASAGQAWSKELGSAITDVAVDEYGNHLIVATSNGMLYCYNTEGSTTWSKTFTGTSVNYVKIDSNSTRYVAALSNYTVVYGNGDTGAVLDMDNIGEDIIDIDISMDGDEWAYRSDSNIFVKMENGGTYEYLMNNFSINADTNGEISIDPDKEWVAASRQNYVQLYAKENSSWSAEGDIYGGMENWSYRMPISINSGAYDYTRFNIYTDADASGNTGDLIEGFDQWVELNDSAGFADRRHITNLVEYDGKLWFVGGQHSTTYYGDVWYTEDGTYWYCAAPTPAFTDRYGAQLLSYNNKLWLIGGWNNTAAGIFGRDVWYSTDGATWTSATRNAPFGSRMFHQSVVFDGKMWVIGGEGTNTGSVVYNDMWWSSDGANWYNFTDSFLNKVTGLNTSLYFTDADYIELDSKVLTSTNTWTLEFWAEYDNINSMPIGENYTTNSDFVYFYTTDDSVKIKPYGTTGSSITIGTTGALTAVYDGDIHHFAVVYRLNVSDSYYWFDLYIDGAKDSVSTKDTFASAPHGWAMQYIGGHVYSSSYAYDGQMDEVRLWNYNRSEAQIGANYSSELLGNESGLIHYWKFDEGSSASVYDTITTGGVNGVILGNWFEWKDDPIAYLNSIWGKRYGHMSYYFDNKFWVMGGNQYSGGTVAKNDTWYTTDMRHWVQSNDAPWSPRYLTHHTVFEDKMWVFGGWDGSNPHNDVWYTDDGLSWTEAIDVAPFETRHGGYAANYSNMLLIVAGGGSGTTDYNDVWRDARPSIQINLNDSNVRDDYGDIRFTDDEFKLLTYQNQISGWTQEMPEPADPLNLRGAELVSFNGSIWLIGGYDGATYHDNVYVSQDNGSTWFLVNGAPGWGGRAYHTAVAYDDKIWIVGGHYGSSNNRDDCWYSEDGVNWVQATSDLPFDKRHGHSMVVFDNKMWIHGGFTYDDNDIKLNDLWYSTDGANWTEATAGYDEFGTALEFNNGNGYVEIPYNDSMYIDTQFTIEFWAKPRTYDDYSTSYCIASQRSASAGWLAYHYYGHPRFYGYRTGPASNYYDVYPWDEIDRWRHNAIVYNESETFNYKYYIDGVLAYETTITDVNSTAGIAVQIGHDVGGTVYYRGFVDEFRMWNISRSQADIQADMNHELVGTEGGLILYLKFNEGEGTTINDSSIYGNDGTIASGSTYVYWRNSDAGTNNGGATIRTSHHSEMVVHNGEMYAAVNNDYHDSAVSRVGEIYHTADGNDWTAETDDAGSVFGHALKLEDDLDYEGHLSFYSNDYLNVAAGNWTVEMRIRLDDAASRTNLWSADIDNQNQYPSIYSSKIGLYESSWTYGSTTLQSDTWYHVAITHDGSGSYKMYLNGVLDGTASMTAKNLSIRTIGCYFDRNQYGIDGSIDEFRVWDIERSEAEIYSDMDNELTGSEYGLIIYYDFNNQSNFVENQANSGVSTNSYDAIAFKGYTASPKDGQDSERSTPDLYGGGFYSVGGNLYIIQGHNYLNTQQDDVYVSYDNGKSWSLLSTYPMTDRYYFQSCWHNGRVVLYGGYDPSEEDDTWWSNDFIDWHVASLTDRYGHTMLNYNDKFWILGGYTQDSYTDDIFYSDDGGESWNQVYINTPWHERIYHKSVVFNNKMWVIGGWDGTNYYNDCWWSTDGVTWNLATGSPVDRGFGNNFEFTSVGTNDGEITVTDDAILHLQSDLTIEMWLKPTTFTQRLTPVTKAYGGEFGISQETSGKIFFYYGTTGANSGTLGSTYQKVEANTSLQMSQWNHVAIVKDISGTGNVTIYLNGVKDADAGALFPLATASTLDMIIGNGNGWVDTAYNGYIDDVRIWNTARTQNQIQTYMNVELSGSEANLVAYYKANTGTGTIAYDETVNNNFGTMTGEVGWGNLSDEITSFGERYGHQVAVFDDKLWLTGGYDGSYKNDVWYTEDGANWILNDASADWSARRFHTLTTFQDQLWVIGGYTGSAVNDVYSSQNGTTWTQENASAAFSVRYGHEVVVNGGYMWLIGGYNDLGDVYSSNNGEFWTQETTHQIRWDGRHYFGAIVDQQKIYLYGGPDDSDCWSGLYSGIFLVEHDTPADDIYLYYGKAVSSPNSTVIGYPNTNTDVTIGSEEDRPEAMYSYKTQKSFTGNIAVMDVPEGGGWLAISTASNLYHQALSTAGFSTAYSVVRSGTPYAIAAADSCAFTIEGRNLGADVYQIDGTAVGAYTTGGLVRSTAISMKNSLWAAAGGDDGKFYIFSKDESSNWYLSYSSDSYEPVTAVDITWRGEYALIGRSDGSVLLYATGTSDTSSSTTDTTFTMHGTVYKDGAFYSGVTVAIYESTTTNPYDWDAFLTVVTDGSGGFTGTLTSGNSYKFVVNTDELEKIIVADSTRAYITLVVSTVSFNYNYEFDAYIDNDDIVATYDDEMTAQSVTITIVDMNTKQTIYTNTETSTSSVEERKQIDPDNMHSYKVMFDIVRYDGSTVKVQKMVNTDFGFTISLPTDDVFLMNVIFVIVLMVLAGLFSWATGPMGALVVAMFALALRYFGWITIEYWAIGLAFLMALLATLARGGGKT